MSVRDKVVVITGGTRGIGRAIAEECTRQGAKVVICGRDEARVAEATAALASVAPGADACGTPADVADYSAVEGLRDFALERHGRIDVWFNNAGISLGYRPVDETPADELARIVEINLTGHLYGARAVLPHFREHGGYLMNMCGRGYRGEATPHTAAYAATKAAISSLTKSLAAESTDVERLSINGFVPGMVETDFYVDMEISPRLRSSAGNWRYAMNAFGVPMDTVAREATRILGEEPGRRTGHIYSLLTFGRVARGSALMAWYGMSGKMAKD